MDNQPYICLNEGAALPLLLMAEHAGAEIPSAYGMLGLDPENIKTERNLLFDSGAAGVTVQLAERLSATAVMGRYSRLLIDINRKDPAHFFPQSAHGMDIPLNKHLSEAEKEERIKKYYKPFHDEAERQIHRLMRAQTKPAVLSLHSYTPAVGLAQAEEKGREAPDIGILYVEENELVRAIRTVVESEPGVSSADNFPYDLRRVPAGSIHSHALEKGLLGVVVEISIDRLKTAEDENYFAGLLAKACEIYLGRK